MDTTWIPPSTKTILYTSMSSSPDCAPEADFARASTIHLRNANLVEISPILERASEETSLAGDIHSSQDLVKTSANPENSCVAIISPKLYPDSPIDPADLDSRLDTVQYPHQERSIRRLWECTIALVLGLIPLLIVTGYLYTPRRELHLVNPGDPAQAVQSIMLASTAPNLLELLEFYSNKRITLLYTLGSIDLTTVLPLVAELIIIRPPDLQVRELIKIKDLLDMYSSTSLLI